VTAFVHLRLHTEYSLVDGVGRGDDLVDACAKAGMPACAVTDQSNLFAMVKFYRAALAAGIKPIIGVDLWIREATEVKYVKRSDIVREAHLYFAFNLQISEASTRCFLTKYRRR
jgi:DNA polymerase-3 subunit alpha